MPTLANEIIEAAIAGFEAQKERITAQITELRAMLNGSAPPAQDHSTRAKRKFSPQALRRMREGQRRRWAEAKGEKAAAPSQEKKSKRRLSAAGRKAIVDALKKRWAAKKAASVQSPAAKTARRKKAA